jgi:hypothetical protein
MPGIPARHPDGLPSFEDFSTVQNLRPHRWHVRSRAIEFGCRAVRVTPLSILPHFGQMSPSWSLAMSEYMMQI